MGIVADEMTRSAANRAKPRSLWRRISEVLDRFVARRGKRAVPAVVLRRSKYDIDRCHRLMLEGAISRIDGATKND